MGVTAILSQWAFPRPVCGTSLWPASVAKRRIRNGVGGCKPLPCKLFRELNAMTQRFTLTVNGTSHTINADPDMPLLYALRDDIGLNNPHFGCGLAQCGACTVHLDGRPARSCITTISSVGDAKITTLAGLGTPEKPHPLQAAYVQEQVPQCGYCINGWLMTAAAFLRDKKKPTEAEIKDALSGLKCRCGTHISILKAVKRAAEMIV